MIHVAALRGEGAGSREDYHRVNVLGTEALLDASLRHGVSRFIHCSSVGVYGTIPPEVPASPETGLHGDNEYHRSKVLAEERVREYIGKGLNAYIVRPTVTYGDGDDGFPSTLAGLVRRRMFPLPARSPRIHLLDVDKLAEVFIGLLKAGDLGERVFLVADAEPVPLSELVDLISRHYRRSPYPSFPRLPVAAVTVMAGILGMIGSGKWLVRLLLITRDWHYDIGRTIRLLGFEPADTRKNFPAFLAGKADRQGKQLDRL